jgi:hypothetical protein
LSAIAKKKPVIPGREPLGERTRNLATEKALPRRAVGFAASLRVSPFAPAMTTSGVGGSFAL